MSLRRYGPGKFDLEIDAHVYRLSLDGPDEECGEVAIGGWFGLMRGPFEELPDGCTDEERELLTTTAGAILSENDQGFVSVEYHDTPAELDAAWKWVLDHQPDEDEEDEG